MKDRFSGQPSHTSETNRVSSLLFLGVLLFATLVVPGIALTTQWVMDIPAVEKAESQARVFELNAEERETLRRFHHTRVARQSIRRCHNHLPFPFGRDRIALQTHIGRGNPERQRRSLRSDSEKPVSHSAPCYKAFASK